MKSKWGGNITSDFIITLAFEEHTPSVIYTIYYYITLSRQLKSSLVALVDLYPEVGLI